MFRGKCLQINEKHKTKSSAQMSLFNGLEQGDHVSWEIIDDSTDEAGDCGELFKG